MRSPQAIPSEADLIYRYVVSSTEMRHIERAERRVYLAVGPDGQLRLWGEIPGCGEACRADLGALLLEYALSHEGTDRDAWRQAAQTFAERLAEAVAHAVGPGGAAGGPAGLAQTALEAVLASFAAGSPVPRAGEPRTYRFDACPVCVTAAASGTARVSEAAHELLHALCRAVVQVSAPGWTVVGGDDVRPGHTLTLSLEADNQP